MRIHTHVTAALIASKSRTPLVILLTMVSLATFHSGGFAAAIATAAVDLDNKVSIFAYIKDNIDAQTGELKEGAFELPDEQFRLNRIGVRWDPGALDSVSDSISLQRSKILAKKIIKVLARVANTNSDQAKAELYRLLMNDDVVIYFDAIIAEVAKQKIEQDIYLHPYLNFLVRKSPDRGPIKFSIAMLGQLADPRDLALIHTLGLHEEFTLYSAVAIAKILPQPDVALWELAQKVNGWGRIQIVEMLADTKNEQIQKWILYEGYRNSISYKYLTYIAATTGNLNAALAKKIIADELLVSAGEIIKAMLDAAPKQDMNSFEHAGPVVENYLRHVALHRKKTKIDSLLVVDAIRTYLTEHSAAKKLVTAQGWNKIKIQQSLAQIDKIMSWKSWPRLTQNLLLSSSNLNFYQANRAANILGINTWRAHWQRLNDKPTDSGRWNEVMQLADESNIADIIDLAKKKLPLEKISSGPSNALGLGPEYRIHSSLDLILQNLERFPCQGWTLIYTGLRSPVIRNRVMAIKALQSWDSNKWSKKMRDSLLEVYENEPEQEVKQSLMVLLNSD